jgi:hypothetical protein
MNYAQLEGIASNFINGNIQDAKRKAKRIGAGTIAQHLRDEYGWTPDRAWITAAFLKNDPAITWQQVCDAK